MKTKLIIALIASHVLANPSCPTITTHSICPTCPVNACLSLSTVTIPCGCPTAAVPTSTISHPCPSNSADKCWAPNCAGTSYAFVTESCPPTSYPTPTSTPPTGPVCPTVTTSIRPPSCTQPPPPPGASFCAEPACIQLKSVTWPCSCVGQQLKTETVEECKCRTGCETSTRVVYLPCPTSVPSPTPTGGGGGGCA